MATDKPTSKGQAWFCAGLASDVVIEVGDMSFHLHKFPLMARCQKLSLIILDQDKNPPHKRTEGRDGEGEAAETEYEIEEEDTYHVTLPDFPGGPEAFELAAKFCYNVKVEITPSNVVPLRCAAEFLEMIEDYFEDNLITRSERFLSQSVLRSLKDSITALRSCDGLLMPMAEELGLVQRCVDSIATKACSDPASLFGWPMNESGRVGNHSVIPNRVLWNGIETKDRRKNGTRGKPASSAVTAVLADSWLDDLTGLSLPVYKRVIAAMKAQDLSPDVIEGSLISYAKRSIPGLSRSSRKSSSVQLPSEEEQIELLETVVTNLPSQKSTASTTTRFLFGLLKTVNILRASDDARETLERKIGSQLEQATLDDLLMPSYSYLVETLYDVDCVERMVGYFLEALQERAVTVGASAAAEDGGDEDAVVGRSPQPISPLMVVGKLIDGYLSEIASDANLKPEKFCSLAFALPEHARVYDDGLYRAVDVYLKAHPRISEVEREKICGVMDCQKLTLEACTHAAQNERLPLRAVVQVLFFEQLQLRHAIAGTLLTAERHQPESARLSRLYHLEESAGGAGGTQGGTWQLAVRDNQVLRLDMDSVRNRVHELERECSTMKKAIEKIDRSAVTAAAGSGSPGWGMSKKFGCKFRTQVCDSHERSIVEARKCRTEEQST